MSRLRLAPGVAATIARTSLAAHPEEGCGYLIGRDHAVAEEARPTRNVHPGPRHSRYLVDPMEFIDLEDALERDGRRILGIFHSHPGSPAVPSATDLASALPGLYYVIHDARQRRAGPMRAWRLDDDVFAEVPLEET